MSIVFLDAPEKGSILIPEKEIWHDLGCGNREPGSEVRDAVAECLELLGPPDFKACYARLPLTFSEEGWPDLGFGPLLSRDLRENLKGCRDVWLFAATMGPRIDGLIREYTVRAPSRAVIFQGIGAAAIESYCNELNGRLCEKAAEAGEFLRPRFSPGYGDLALECQRGIFRILDCPRRIGLTLLDSCLMAPSKSVTAIIGISDSASPGIKSGCALCGKTDCRFRRVD